MALRKLRSLESVKGIQGPYSDPRTHAFIERISNLTDLQILVCMVRLHSMCLARYRFYLFLCCLNVFSLHLSSLFSSFFFSLSSLFPSSFLAFEKERLDRLYRSCCYDCSYYHQPCGFFIQFPLFLSCRLGSGFFCRTRPRRSGRETIRCLARATRGWGSARLCLKLSTALPSGREGMMGVLWTRKS